MLVVTSFDELQRRAPEAKGKIVVYNQPYANYSKTVEYRVQGAVEAAKVGALASLIRSVASFSIYRWVMMLIWNTFKNQAFSRKQNHYKIKTNHFNEKKLIAHEIFPHSIFGHLFVISSLAFSGFQASPVHSLKSFPHPWWSHNIPYLTNILCIFMSGRTEFMSVSHQGFFY